MICSNCEIWELQGGENFCSWCGHARIAFDISLDRHAVSAAEYPPPLLLSIRNRSPEVALLVLRITASAPWLSLLDPGAVPLRVLPGEEELLYIDADTLTAGAPHQSCRLAVHVAHSPAQFADVHID